MTVKELIGWLQEFDDNTEVVIVEYQRHGGDLVYTIDDVGKARYDNWEGENLDEDGACVKLALGYQIGTVIEDY